MDSERSAERPEPAAASAGAPSEEVSELRTASSYTYENSDGTLRAEIYSEPVNYLAASGAYREIENELVASERPGYAAENAANSFTAQFPSELADDPIRVESSEGSVSYVLEGATGTPEVDGESVVYENAKPGVDLRYEMRPTGVEELIVLEDAQTPESYGFDFETTGGLELAPAGDGAVVEDELGEQVFEILPPVVYDAAGESDQMELEIEGPASGPTVELAPDPEWLADPERAYPVTIDPTVVLGSGEDPSGIEPGKDCWIGSGTEDANSYCRGALRVRNNATTAATKRRSLLEFPLGSLEQSDTILSAQLQLEVSPSSAGAMEMGVHRVLREWNDTQVTWKKRTSSVDWETPGGHIVETAAATNAQVGEQPGAKESWDVKALVDRWVNDPDTFPRHGLLLKPGPSAAGGVEVSFASSDEENTASRPQLIVNYQSPLGLTAVAQPGGYSARLNWQPSSGFSPTRYAIRRREVYPGGPTSAWRLIDSVPVSAFTSSPPTYLDHLLWRGTTYEYEVQAFASDDGSAPGPADVGRVTTATPERDVPFPRLYADTSFWNRTIEQRYGSTKPTSQQANAKFASSSDIVQASFVDPPRYICPGEPGYVAGQNTREYDPALPNCGVSPPNFTATHSWGVSLVYADPASKLYDPIGCTSYCNTPSSFRLPAYASLKRTELDSEGVEQTYWGAATNGEDGKLAVINHVSGQELGFLAATVQPHDEDLAGDEKWSGTGRFVSQALGANATGLVCAPSAYKCNGPTVAGFPNMGGIVRPEEILERKIRHALAIGMPNARAVIACPATHTGGTTGDKRYSWYDSAVPIGAHVQLDPDYQIPTTWPPAAQTIARALQVYGAYVDDRSGSVSIQAETDIGRGYPVWEDLGTANEDDAKIDELMTASAQPEQQKGRASIGLADLNPTFPLAKLRVLTIKENTGPDACTGG